MATLSAAIDKGVTLTNSIARRGGLIDKPPVISAGFSAFFHKELSHSTVFAQQPFEF
jgi:hypothetical protein